MYFLSWAGSSMLIPKDSWTFRRLERKIKVTVNFCVCEHGYLPNCAHLPSSRLKSTGIMLAITSVGSTLHLAQVSCPITCLHMVFAIGYVEHFGLTLTVWLPGMNTSITAFLKDFLGFYCSLFQLLFVLGFFCLQSPLQEVECILNWVNVWWLTWPI